MRVIEDKDFSDLKRLKAPYLALFGDQEHLRDALNDPKLWTLSQERHLIVHRRGRVDSVFIEATGTPSKRGEQLQITPRELEARIDTVVAAALAIGITTTDAIAT